MASVSDMQRILEKLGFGALTERFIDQRITPGMVCKLSLYEFYQLGLHNPSEIMTLTLCLPGHENFGYIWSFFNSRLTIVYYDQKK